LTRRVRSVHADVPQRAQHDGARSGTTAKAFILFISPTQVNILTPLNLTNSCCLVQIQVPYEGQTAVNCELADTNQAFSECGYGQVVPASPEFFLWPGTSYIVAEHANGSLIGPIGLGPGSTPAKPGETVVLYANGLGAVSGNVVSGSDGSLPRLPCCRKSTWVAVPLRLTSQD
jgi:uncharacterized protein (TIGR03437 family)